MKKIYVRAYQNINLGDDLFLEILFTRYKNVDFYINDCFLYRENFKNFKNVHFLKNNKVKKNIDRIKRGINKYILKKNNGFVYTIDYDFFDAFVYIGGSIFKDDEQQNHFPRMAYIINNFANREKPIYMLGCNFEKHYEVDFLSNYREFFDKLGNRFDICFRDQFSYKLFNHIQNVRFAPDIVFSLRYKKMILKEKYIGFSIIDLADRAELSAYEEVYIYNVVELIKKSIEEKNKVVLFSFCENEGDLTGIKKIMGKLSSLYKKHIKIFNHTGNVTETLECFSSMAVIIGTRFHSVVLSQVFGQGVLPIIYSDKTLNVLNDIGLNDIYIDIRENNKISNINYIWSKIENNKILVNNLQKDAEIHFQKLDVFLKSNL